jgi:hypothetical protein
MQLRQYTPVVSETFVQQIVDSGQGVRNSCHSHLTSSRRFVIDRLGRDRAFTCSRASRSSDDRGARTPVSCADSRATP